VLRFSAQDRVPFRISATLVQGVEGDIESTGTRRLLTIVVTLIISLSAGCGLMLDLTGHPTDDGSTSLDGGADSGSTADSGSLSDGGMGIDGGVVDSGGGVSDTGVMVRDGGTTDVDPVGGFGQTCDSDEDCGSGLCYDASLSNPFCMGNTCTIPCMLWTDCRDFAVLMGGTSSIRSCVSDSTGRSVCDFSFDLVVELMCE
jgi:hypothetical protein